MEKKIEKLKKEELKPSYSKLKSFHEKAWVITDEKGNKKLQSFESIIAEIIDNEVIIHDEVKMWDSKTSLRHLINFLHSNNKPIGNKKEIVELYITKTKKTENVEDKEEIKQSTDEKLKNKKNENPKIEEKSNEDSKVEKTTTTKSKNKKVENSKTENQEELVEVGA